MIVEMNSMKKWLAILSGILMAILMAFTIHAFAKDYRSYNEESEPETTKPARTVKTYRNNEADLVRICAEITKTKRQSDLTVYEPTEEQTEEPSKEEQDENLALWLSKAADYNASEEIVTFLYETMKAAGIEQMMRFGMAQIFQESRFTITAENQQNHLDMGILQYRITYWSAVCKEHGFPEDTSIFDWQTQIRIYTQDMARRLASGLSVEETISRHKTSDYGSYDAVYVEQVMRWVK